MDSSLFLYGGLGLFAATLGTVRSRCLIRRVTLVFACTQVASLDARGTTCSDDYQLILVLRLVGHLLASARREADDPTRSGRLSSPF